MIIFDLNVLETVEASEIIGGFRTGKGKYEFETEYETEIESEIKLKLGTHGAVGDVYSEAAPLTTFGASTAGIELTTLAGLPAGFASGGKYFVGSIAAGRSYAASSF